MDIVILKGSLYDRYRNNYTFIAFSIQDTVTHVRKMIEAFVQLVSSGLKH